MRIKTPTAIQIQNAITSMWNGRMTVYGNKSVFNEVTKITEIENDVVLAKDIPCRISFKTISKVSEQDGAFKTVQEIKLFCAPEIEIVEGSRLVITHIIKKLFYLWWRIGLNDTL